ncbi:MAG TPA: DNA-binding protein [Alicycliphilus sp.]|nr:DNA-binding protein [Alicycliphilus sp.]
MAISIEDVYSAADRLSESGQQPTLAAVRSALGGGSFTTISEAMKSWRAMQQAAATPVREAAPAAVMERFSQLGVDVWGVAVSMANDRLAKEREVFEGAKADMERAHKEAAELADQMAVELESTRKQLEQQGVLLHTAQEATHTAQASLADAQRRADGLTELLERERALSKEIQVKAEKAIADAARLAGKLEVLEAQGRQGS